MSNVTDQNEKSSRLVIVAVNDDKIGKNTLQWYKDNIHQPDSEVHVCYVPDFRQKLSPRMSAQDILTVMQLTNNYGDNLQKVFERSIEEMGLQGRFVRIGGTQPWSALTEYCRKKKASLLILTSKLSPGNIPDEPQHLSQLVLGKMTTDILVHCPVPVLVARPIQPVLPTN